MGQYRVVYSPKAKRQLKAMDINAAKRITEKIESLSMNPYPPQAIKLKGEDDFHRIRCGDYRVVYFIEHVVKIVEIVRIDRRDKVYRQL